VALARLVSADNDLYLHPRTERAACAIADSLAPADPALATTLAQLPAGPGIFSFALPPRGVVAVGAADRHQFQYRASLYLTSAHVAHVVRCTGGRNCIQAGRLDLRPGHFLAPGCHFLHPAVDQGPSADADVVAASPAWRFCYLPVLPCFY